MNLTPFIEFVRSLDDAVILAVWGVVCLLFLGLGLGLWVAIEKRITRPSTWLAGKPRDTGHQAAHSQTTPRPAADEEPPTGRHSLGNPDLSQEIPAAALIAAWAANQRAGAPNATTEGAPQ